MAGTGDTRQPSYPLSTHKQDWAFYPYSGGRGSVTPVQCNTTRYSFWVDFDPHDIKNLRMLSQNVSFQVFTDNTLATPIVPYEVIYQSNDFTDELVQSLLPLTEGESVSFNGLSVSKPPFGYLDSGEGTPSAGVPPVSSAYDGPTTITAGATNNAGQTVNSQLVIGQTYYYCVTATIGGTESLPSAVVNATPTATEPDIAVGFAEVPGAATYTIYRNTTGSFSSGNLLLSAYYMPGQPPYYNITNFVSQPADNNYRTDQGFWTLSGYHNNGYGFGSGNMLCQGFTPENPQLTALFLGGLFNTNGTDHTKYDDVYVEIWDSASHQLLRMTVHPQLTQQLITNSEIAADNCTLICNSYSYNFGDDGNLYWATLTQPVLRLLTPLALHVGTGYNIVVRKANQVASNYYFLGLNTLSTGTRDPMYYYPFGNAFTATDGAVIGTWSNLVDSNSKNVTFPFMTEGNIGRYAVTYWWNGLGNGASNYYPEVPNNNEYSFLQIDYNQRI